MSGYPCHPRRGRSNHSSCDQVQAPVTLTAILRGLTLHPLTHLQPTHRKMTTPERRTLLPRALYRDYHTLYPPTQTFHSYPKAVAYTSSIHNATKHTKATNGPSTLRHKHFFCTPTCSTYDIPLHTTQPKIPLTHYAPKITTLHNINNTASTHNATNTSTTHINLHGQQA